MKHTDYGFGIGWNIIPWLCLRWWHRSGLVLLRSSRTSQLCRNREAADHWTFFLSEAHIRRWRSFVARWLSDRLYLLYGEEKRRCIQYAPSLIQSIGDRYQCILLFTATNAAIEGHLCPHQYFGRRVVEWLTSIGPSKVLTSAWKSTNWSDDGALN